MADVPIYFADAIARRSEPLLRTADSPTHHWRSLPAALADKLGVQGWRQGQSDPRRTGSAILVAGIDARLPANAVRVASSHPATATLGAMFGAITVEKAGEGI